MKPHSYVDDYEQCAECGTMRPWKGLAGGACVGQFFCLDKAWCERQQRIRAEVADLFREEGALVVPPDGGGLHIEYSQEVRSAKFAAEEKANRLRGKVAQPRFCELCGKDITLRRKGAKLCSRACWERRQKRGNRVAKMPKPARECPVCGKDITQRANGRAKTCSKRCKDRFHRGWVRASA